MQANSRTGMRLTVASFGLLAVCVLAACSDSLAPQDFEGDWGGNEATFLLAPTHGFFDSSCWTGEITFPLHVDGHTFDSQGTVTSKGGAGGSESRFATFRGTLSGDELHLEVTPASLGLGPYTMTRGAQVQIPGCPEPAGD